MRLSGIDRYRVVLRTPGIRPTLAAGFILKLAVIAIPIVLTLHVALGLGKGLGAAGLVVSGWLVGVTVGAPLQGAAIDKWGLRPALLFSAAVQGVFWGMAPLLPLSALMVSATASGVLLIPGSTPVRLVIAALVPEGQRQTGFAIDSMLTELSYLVGPALGALVTTEASSTAAMRGLGFVSLLGGVSIAMLRRRQDATAAEVGGEREGTRPPTPWKSLIALLACVFAVGGTTSGFEIAMVGLMRHVGSAQWIGVLLSACGVYALVGGFVLGASRLTVRTWAGALVLGMVVIPIGWVTDWRVLLAVVAPAAVLSSVTLAAGASEVSRFATAATQGRVMSLYGAALAGGNAVGAPLVGFAVSAGGPVIGFVTAGGGAIVVSLAIKLMFSSRDPHIPVGSTARLVDSTAAPTPLGD
ncbi:MFS transporter [Actinoallomurus sp. CA-150999]|uniref:MFS transporter n=1 Tax=Actinoallomurus sp. CA-150999 TaxID=3239887 RepID=UPI003D94F9BA